MLYICTKFCQSTSKGFRVTDLNSRINARVVVNVDLQKYGRMNGRKMGFLYLAMPGGPGFDTWSGNILSFLLPLF